MRDTGFDPVTPSVSATFVAQAPEEAPQPRTTSRANLFAKDDDDLRQFSSCEGRWRILDLLLHERAHELEKGGKRLEQGTIPNINAA